MTGPAVEVALVGAGPTASSLLERLAANHGELLAGRPLVVHLIDPHPPGVGRVWRPDQDPRLWMNSMAEDVTMFVGDAVVCEGPRRPGPSLIEWARTTEPEVLRSLTGPEVAAEIRGLDGTAFPTRLVQTAYLDWFLRQVLADLPPGMSVTVHPHSALDIVDRTDGRQEVVLDGGAGRLVVDAVVLALGHLDADPDDCGRSLTDFARRRGLAYVPPGHTAEQDLSVLFPGDDVLVLGFGQAFTDLLVLLSEGRGGRFLPDGDGLRYEASGEEPILHVGSRRGVPYRSKLDYRLVGPPPPVPMFLDEETVSALLRGDELLDFRRDVLPLVLKEVGWASYHELLVAHPDRATMSWADFADAYRPLPEGPALQELVARAVPDPEDRFDLARLDRPLTGLRFGSAGELQAHVRRHIADDVARRTDPAHSADLAAFLALLITFGAIARLTAAGRFTPRSQVEDVGRWWFSFFMYYASGPPPQRLRQLLALADAGVVRFLGADTVISADQDSGRFVARSSSHPDTVAGVALVDARIASPSVSRTRNPLLRQLHHRGAVTEEVAVEAGTGWSANTGKVLVDGADLRLVQADGSRHPRRHGLGVFTSRPAAGAFARPGTNAPAFRQNDAVARSILTSLSQLEPAGSTPAPD